MRLDVKLAGMLLAAIGTAFSGYKVVEAGAASAAHAEAEVLEAKHVALNEQVQHQGSEIRAAREDIHEVANDVRELYRFINTGSPSSRLEAPPTPAKPAIDAGH